MVQPSSWLLLLISATDFVGWDLNCFMWDPLTISNNQREKDDCLVPLFFVYQLNLASRSSSQKTRVESSHFGWPSAFFYSVGNFCPFSYACVCSFSPKELLQVVWGDEETRTHLCVHEVRFSLLPKFVNHRITENHAKTHLLRSTNWIFNLSNSHSKTSTLKFSRKNSN